MAETLSDGDRVEVRTGEYAGWHGWILGWQGADVILTLADGFTVLTLPVEQVRLIRSKS